MRITTLCYLQSGSKYLMLHRTKKKDDPNHAKWIGVGGGIENNETPDECLLREVWEETGLTLTKWRKRGVIDFISDDFSEIMHLYTASEWTGTLHECPEGELAWIEIAEIPKLPLWEGDRVFLKLLREDSPCFQLRLEYSGESLVRAVLNGNELKL